MSLKKILIMVVVGIILLALAVIGFYFVPLFFFDLVM